MKSEKTIESLICKINDHPANLLLEVRYGQKIKSQSFSFLDWIHSANDLATQIPKDVGWPLITYTGRNYLPHRESNQLRIPYYDLKAVCLKSCDHSAGLHKFRKCTTFP